MPPRRHKPRSISAPDELWAQIEHEATVTSQSSSAVVVNILSNYFRSKITRNSSWETDDDDWYDPNRFYTFSQDKYGHSAKIEVTIPKHIAGEIRGLIDAGRISELRNAQDFYRNAIRHETYRIGKMIQDETLVEASHTMDIMDQIIHDQALASDTQKLIASIEDLFDEALILGHLDFVESRLKDLWKGASSVSERFRETYMDTLRKYQEELAEAKERKRRRGTVEYPDGSRWKNGVELAPPKSRRNPNTE